MTTVSKRTSEIAPLLLLVCAAALLVACASSANNVDITKPVTGEASTNAEKAYRKGLEEKSSSAYLEATRYFEWVRNNFPYSQYAALSELALADMAFERDDFATAATSYQEFVKSHPSHPKADFAAFRIGLAHYRDKPTDSVLLPPAHEKDQAPVKSALDALQRFVLGYPKSEFTPEARRLISDCRDRLAEHERYVADFYWKRGKWKGAAGRLVGLADTYGDLDGGKLRGDSLWRAGMAYRNLNDVADERVTLMRLVQEAPYDPHRKDAESILKSLPADAPKPAPEPAKTSPGEVKPAPLTPAETPGSPRERPQADPGPGQPPGDANLPERPEAAPKPARPTNEEPKPGPTSQPPTPPLAPPDR